MLWFRQIKGIFLPRDTFKKLLPIVGQSFSPEMLSEYARLGSRLLNKDMWWKRGWTNTLKVKCQGLRPRSHFLASLRHDNNLSSWRRKLQRILRNVFVRIKNERTKVLLTEGRRIQWSVKDHRSQADVSVMVTV